MDVIISSPLSPATAPFIWVISTCIVLLTLATGCQRQAVPISEGYVDPLAEYKYSCRPIDSTEVLAVLPALEAEFGAFVDCPAVYRAKLLAALSFYPDLKGVHVTIVRKALPTSMAARPSNYAVARNGRRYKIYVDDVTDKVTDFRRYPYSAQIGCFIHELGHVAYYEGRSNARLFADGTRYVSSQSFRSRYERYADHNAIARGGGYYGYLFRKYTLTEAGISPEYRAFKRKNYYTPERLRELYLKELRDNGLRVSDCFDGVTSSSAP